MFYCCVFWEGMGVVGNGDWCPFVMGLRAMSPKKAKLSLTQPHIPWLPGRWVPKNETEDLLFNEVKKTLLHTNEFLRSLILKMFCIARLKMPWGLWAPLSGLWQTGWFNEGWEDVIKIDSQWLSSWDVDRRLPSEVEILFWAKAFSELGVLWSIIYPKNVLRQSLTEYTDTHFHW